MIVEVPGTINEPVSLDDAKEHLRVSHSDEDNYILSLTTVARKMVERELDETLHSATYDYYLYGFPSGNIELPKPPLMGVTHVKYYDLDNVLQTLYEDVDYFVTTLTDPGMIEVIDTWPDTYERGAAVQIRYTAGQTAENIQPDILHAMKLKISLLYNDREGTDEFEGGYIRLINKLRKPKFG